MVTPMTMNKLLTAVVLMLGLTACDSGENAAAPAAKTSADKAAGTSMHRQSPGKLSAPIIIQYTVKGTPLLGQPLTVEVRVASPQTTETVRLSYFINDTDSMMFAESQPESVEIELPGDDEFASREVRVVPLREGRLYLNVTAELETVGGTMLKSISVPIAVGDNPGTAALNGELDDKVDGEPVISMPARED